MYSRYAGVVLAAIVALPALTGVGTPRAEAPVVGPDYNAPYLDADVAYWRGVFEQGGREVYARRDEILAAQNLPRGAEVADVGAGTGFYSLLFAEAVGPEGRVYAVDISPDFITAIGERVRAAGMTNISPVINAADDVKLPDNSIDVAFICDTYHHFEYPESVMRSLHRALRPGGEVVVVDYRKVPGRSSPWVMHHVRLDSEQAKAEITGFGYELVEERDFLHTQYFLRFRKLEGDAP